MPAAAVIPTDAAVAANDEHRGIPIVEPFIEKLTGAPAYRPGDLVFFTEGAGRRFVVRRQTDKDNIVASKLLIDLNQVRRETLARWSPERPYVENDDPPSKLLPVERNAFAPTPGLQKRWKFAGAAAWSFERRRHRNFYPQGVHRTRAKRESCEEADEQRRDFQPNVRPTPAHSPPKLEKPTDHQHIRSDSIVQIPHQSGATGQAQRQADPQVRQPCGNPNLKPRHAPQARE